jgi:hypothetical protein
MELVRAGRWLFVVFFFNLSGLLHAQAGNSQPPSSDVAEQAALDELLATYDPAIFLNRMPAPQLDFMRQYDGAPAKSLLKDKQFKNTLKAVVPDCMFHYGRDMPARDAMDLVMSDSKTPVSIRDGRYLTVSGTNGPYLSGKAFLWIDLQEGIGIGGFYFHPTNGEPSPTLTVFSRQIKESALSMGQLPPDFARDLGEWEGISRVPLLSTRYFIGEPKKRILLEHDEDYCLQQNGTMASPQSGCQQMNADAADLDMNAAYYLDQVHHATNATAWMITGADQVAWLDVRTHTCGIDVACRIRVTRVHTAVMVGHRPHPTPHPIHH